MRLAADRLAPVNSVDRPPRDHPLRVALLGCGVVGTEVARRLTRDADELARRVGVPLELVAIAVRDLAVKRDLDVPAELFTDDAALAQAAREIRVHGQSARYQHTRVGVGGRMDTLQCAIVLGKLGRFEWELEQRAAIGARYDALLDAAGIERIAVRPDRTSVSG